jgi:hypothetical protein
MKILKAIWSFLTYDHPRIRTKCEITKTGDHVMREIHDVFLRAKCGACNQWYDL